MSIRLSFICLIALSTAIFAEPALSYGIDYQDQEALRDTRSELLKKRDELLREQDALSSEVTNLYAELKYKKDQLTQIQSELGRTEQTINDIERNLVR